MARARTKRAQEAFEFPNGWGGRRKGAGAKPKGVRPGVPHATRELLASRFPVHVTVKLRAGLPSLRSHGAFETLLRVFAALRARAQFRIVHFSVQSNHVHLVCEARDRVELARGVQSFAIRVAKRLNALWRRADKLFADRYHAHILRTPREVRHAIAYVLNNALKHGVRLPERDIDPCSSGVCPERTAAPRTWLLTLGWRRGAQPSGP